MATMKIVPAADYEVLRKYLGGESGVVLVPLDFVVTLPPDQQKLVHASNGQDVPYDFGGECDTMVDVADNLDAFFFNRSQD